MYVVNKPMAVALGSLCFIVPALLWFVPAPLCTHISSDCTTDSLSQMGKELLTADQLSSIDHGIGSPSGNLVKHGIKAKKPDFEVGSSSQLKLSFVKKNNQAPGKCW